MVRLHEDIREGLGKSADVYQDLISNTLAAGSHRRGNLEKYSSGDGPEAKRSIPTRGIPGSGCIKNLAIASSSRRLRED